MSISFMDYELSEDKGLIDALEAQGVDVTIDIIEEVKARWVEDIQRIQSILDWERELRGKTPLELNALMQSLLQARNWVPAEEGEDSEIDAVRAAVVEAMKDARKSFTAPVYEGDDFVVNTDRVISA